MNIAELGEFGLIEKISALVSKSGTGASAAQKNLIIGIGDDAAAWHGDPSIQLATSDAMVQDIHFRLDLTSWEDLGWRALAANLSDIAAMGGLPRYILVSLSLPATLDVENVIKLYRGMLELSHQSGTIIVGGNLTGSPVIVITITVLGNTPDNAGKLLTRSAAVPGDKVAVTGYLGASAAGLECLKNGMTDASAEPLKKAYLKPVPRIAEGQILVKNGVKAAIDISDGLLADLGHICEASSVSARIESGLIPVHPAAVALFPEKALQYALSGGEDYELLFTAPEKVITRVRESGKCQVTVIGTITAGQPGKVEVTGTDGKIIRPGKTGWKHFAPEVTK